MYERHFGLREPPFSLTPDTAYFFAHASAQGALNTLLVALRSGEGFVKVVAEVGCGKTLLCRRLLAALSVECETAYIPNPNLDARAMLLAVCEELGLFPVDPGASHRVVKDLERLLLERALAGRKVVLIIDEAQAIPDETVESLRLLSNLETEKRKLLQIVLFGQPELDARLARPHLRQLLQRITFAERLEPLCDEEVGAYVDHRLQVAGAEAELFGDEAVLELSRASGGVPRLINVIAHKALMVAFGEGARRVGRRHVAIAARDVGAARRAKRGSWLGGILSYAGRRGPAA